MFSLILSLLTVVSTPNALVYLECATKEPVDAQGTATTTMNWQITLNEAAGTVDYSTDGGSGQQRRVARFTQDKVFFIGFELSRIDLTMRRAGISAGTFQTGTCKLAKSKPRAF